MKNNGWKKSPWSRLQAQNSGKHRQIAPHFCLHREGKNKAGDRAKSIVGAIFHVFVLMYHLIPMIFSFFTSSNFFDRE
jgi:hypothetical protein